MANRQHADESKSDEHESKSDDKPDLRQRLHWATDDREAEAKALADRAGEEVDEEDALAAVKRAHGELRDGKKPEDDDDLATVADAKDEARDSNDSTPR
jgi:hypothetical protein